VESHWRRGTRMGKQKTPDTGGGMAAIGGII
jgi:hypothetical protein